MQFPVLDVLNYGVRISIVCLGLLFVFGDVARIPSDPAFTTYLGIALIVFGLYRSVVYYFKSRRDQEDDSTG